jgi:nucleotide-binding universal stress UspA family protein/cold shock CspA family protein/ribosome-associated translation inhibitor RaiA
MKILLPTDGSRYALAAARALSGWFAWPGGLVDVLAVTPDEPKSDGRDFGKDTEGAQDWRGTVSRWLEETATHLGGSGLRVNELLRRGDPATVAVEVAGDGYDMVAVGAKGRAEAPFFDEDSVALALLERAPTSILLVRERSPRGRARRLPTPQRPLRVLLAVDGRAPSARAANTFSSLVAADHVEIAVLAVADAAMGGSLAESDARAVARRTASVLQGHRFVAQERVAVGDAALAILEAADESDLIVMGSRASADESRLGSVGLAVARSSPCSVLLVREAVPGTTAEGEEEAAVATPVEIAYENMEPASVAEGHVLRGLRRLERVAPNLMGVRVTLAKRNLRRRTGNLYEAHLELTLPGPDVAISRTSPVHSESEDLVTAIGEAFGKARRELIEWRDRNGGNVKAHVPPSHGQVTALFPDHGFILASDGRIVYFHRNSVAGDAWDRMEVGDEVRFSDEPGEKGPHATVVTALPRRHPVA